ncbi:MAG TPA: hypothetical protein VEC93_23570 [Anaerolineae bacterium]|nr:hypothetical protein [Anaerolineae bacterium]
MINRVHRQIIRFRDQGVRNVFRIPDTEAQSFSSLAPRTSGANLLLRLWVIARLPLLLIILYFFAPDEFIWLATISAIHLGGTLPERVVVLVLTGLVLTGSFIFSQRIAFKPLRYLAPLGIAFILFLGLFQLASGPDPLLIAFFLTGVLALNVTSDTRLINFMSKNPGRLITNLIFAIVIGFSEMLLLKPLLLWLPARWQAAQVFKTSAVSRGWLPGLILIPGLAAFLLDPYGLSDLHRAWFPDPAVHLFARENFSWTELDLSRRVLYASGYGTNYLYAYNLDALDQPPLISPIENGYAQGFAYNSLDQEIYVYNVLTHKLLSLDAATLKLKKIIATFQLSPGDVWVAWDQFSDTIILASEADEQVGIPAVIIDRPTGQVLDQLNLDPGNIALHPTKPWLYMSFLRRINELLVYDLAQQQIIKRAPAPERLDRMIFAPGSQGLEFFASAPLDSVVLRFDAETLARQETIKTLFGGRAIAVDSTRNLLLCGSLVTHQLEVIDLTTQQPVATYYLGPWLRTIVLDSKAGIAYVSSHGGLFKVQYADRP